MEREKKQFKKWIEKNRNHDITVNDFINNSHKIEGLNHLYNDDKYLLSRVNTFTSITLGATSTELCLAFPNDESIGFKNPIDEYLDKFFIYGIAIIENCDKMHQTEVLGITVTKKKKNYPNIRYWIPKQGPGEDLYYTNLEECIVKGNMNKDFNNIPTKIWDIFNSDIEKQRKIKKNV